MLSETLPALSIILGRSNALTIQRQAYLPLHKLRTWQRQQPKSSSVDLIAAFTNGLLEKVTNNWQVNHSEKSSKCTKNDGRATPYQNLLGRINSLCSSLDVRTLETVQLNELIVTALECRDRATFDNVIEQCVRHDVLPSTGVLLRILPMLCASEHDDDLEITSKLIRMCEMQNARIYDHHPALRPFHAHQLWHDGNLSEALLYLKGIYKCEDPIEKRNIIETYRRIVKDAVTNRGEAVLHNLVEHADDILVTFNDAAVLQNIYTRCFTSNCFSDRQLASDLFRKHEKLRDLAKLSASFMVFNQLQQQDVDSVHRLIEQVNKNYYELCSPLFFFTLLHLNILPVLGVRHEKSMRHLHGNIIPISM